MIVQHLVWKQFRSLLSLRIVGSHCYGFSLLAYAFEQQTREPGMESEGGNECHLSTIWQKQSQVLEA